MSTKSILIACDLGGTSRAVAEAGFWLADKLQFGASLLHVDGYGTLLSERFHAVDDEQLAAMAEEYRSSACKELQRLVEKMHGDPVAVPIKVRRGRIEEEVVAEAREQDVEAIVVGSRTRVSQERLVVGGTALRIIRHAHRAVFTMDVRHSFDGISRILYAADLEANRHDVNRWVGTLAGRLDAQLTVLHVSELGGRLVGPYVFPAPTINSYHAMRSRRLEELQDELTRLALDVGASPRAVETRLVVSNHPATAILEAAEQDQADLIVLGTHGRGRLARLILGSVTEEVLYKAPTSVLTVREREHESA